MLGSLILYLNGIRIIMFQLSGFYCKPRQFWHWILLMDALYARHYMLGSTLTYQTLLFPSVLIINPNMEFIGTRQKSRFWWVKVESRYEHPPWNPEALQHQCREVVDQGAVVGVTQYMCGTLPDPRVVPGRRVFLVLSKTSRKQAYRTFWSLDLWEALEPTL